VEWSHEAPASAGLTPAPGNGGQPETSGGEVRASAAIGPQEAPEAGASGHRLMSLPGESHSARKKVWVFSLFIVIGLIAIVSLAGLQKRRVEPGGAPRIHSLAVLPLANLSSDEGQDFLADGMTEQLTTDLGKISALRVISRTSVMRYKGTTKPLGEIARELNVDAVVEGTVARSGSHFRITANLVQASPEKHLWAETYEGEIGNAVAMQGEIARAVAREIQVKLTQNEEKLLAVTRPVNPEAQDLYLRGRYMWSEGTAESAQKSISYFQEAIQKDPNYAAAYAGLADVYAVWFPGMNRPRDRMPKAKEYAQKALELDGTLADAHSVLGSVELLYDWDWTAAEEEFQQTIKFNPNHAEAYRWHSRGLVTRGRTQQGVAEAERSLGLSPSPYSWDYPTWVFVLAQHYDLAEERAHELVNLMPNYPWGHFELSLIYERHGRLQEAAEQSLKADELFGTDPKKVAQLKDALHKSGPQGYWKQTLANYIQSGKSGYAPSVLVAEACVRVGDNDCAFEWLERGFEERDDLMINLNVDRVFDPLRSDPRFQNLVRRVGIPN